MGVKGVMWRGFKGLAIFGLGFCTRNALTIYPNELSNKTLEHWAKAKYAKKKYREKLEELKEIGKKLDNLQQILRDQVAKLEEHKRKQL